ncbi:amidophosphoribosyltransferase [Patiriisocius marinistellae]|uniref:Amidophosphoribosyltransferase n=1 Tax=Patiriisocius marinistellae TaxID=2494560 RepID=A0A5J4FU94_9FLAO|nr:amidophosphoribosyltransferase [Patiriisocius marinistellae]
MPLFQQQYAGENSIKNIFYGRIPVVHATALLKFEKQSIVQELMHNLKYRKQEDISAFFGAWLGEKLSALNDYKDIDVVIPVPIHKTKKRERGYNQVSGFGSEIAKALSITFHEDVLLKTANTKTQVFKGRLKRMETAQTLTIKNSHLIKNKHILLVDDIITTGATLENCALQLLKIPNTKISFAAIAMTIS